MSRIRGIRRGVQTASGAWGPVRLSLATVLGSEVANVVGGSGGSDMKPLVTYFGRYSAYRAGSEGRTVTDAGPQLCLAASFRKGRHQAAGGPPVVEAAAGRFRIARIPDKGALRWLAEAAGPGGDARIELVFADGRRERIAQGADEATLRALVASAGRNMDARLELVFRHAEGFRTPE